MRRGLVLAAILLVPCALAAAADDEKVANPPYKNWSSFKPGSYSVIRVSVQDQSNDDPGVIDATARPHGAHEFIRTYRLVSVSPDRAVVSSTQTDLEEGTEHEHSPHRITYFPTVIKHKASGAPKDQISGVKEGDDTIEVGGKAVKCHWVESVMKVDDETSTQKLWYSDKVPGGTVKTVTTKKQGDKVLFKTTATLIDFKGTPAE